jgi:hypothetical protein
MASIPLAVKRFDGCRESLDVLLRHRLLPQPHGFEGFFPRREPGDPDDLAFADCPDARVVSPLNLDPARPPRARVFTTETTQSPASDQLLQVVLHALPCLGVILVPEAPQAFVPGIDTRSDEVRERASGVIPLGLGVEERENGLGVALG